MALFAPIVHSMSCDHNSRTQRAVSTALRFLVRYEYLQREAMSKHGVFDSGLRPASTSASWARPKPDYDEMVALEYACLAAIQATEYTIRCSPSKSDQGIHFYLDSLGGVRLSRDGPADSTSPQALLFPEDVGRWTRDLANR